MDVLSVELGSYSVKFLHGRIERKQVYFEYFEEMILADHFSQEQINDEEGNIFLRLQLARDYFSKQNNIDKIILALPKQFNSSRFLHTPAKSTKIAEQIIPNELEIDEALPFSISEAHFANYHIQEKEGYYSIVDITRRDIFQNFYNDLLDNKIKPNAIIGKDSIYQSLALNSLKDENFAILDIGHEETQCYFFHKKRMVDTAISFIGGAVLNEVISETYQISYEDAVVFKHENSFFLTESQFDTASNEQREFALIMRQLMSGLIDEFKRWKVSYRLRNGAEIDKVYITGGFSNIRNIDNFLTQQLEVPTSHLDYHKSTNISELQLHKDHYQSLTSSLGIFHHYTQKKGLADFRNGEFAAPSEGGLPLHSLSFIGSRVVMVSFILIVTMLFEFLGLNKEQKAYEGLYRSVLKEQELGLTNNLRRNYIKNPSQFNRFIKKKNKELDDQIKLITNSSKINALKPLASLSRMVNENKEVELVEFINKENKIVAKMTSEKVEILESVKGDLEKANLSELKISINDKNKEMTVTYVEI